MDLVGRKLRLDNGNIFRSWFEELASFIKQNKGNNAFSREFHLLDKALAAYKELLSTIFGYFSNDIRMVPLYSTRVLKVTAELCCGCLLMQQALIAEKKLSEGTSEQAFYHGKVQSARFYVRNIVPDVVAITQIIKEGDTSALDIPEEAF